MPWFSEAMPWFSEAMPWFSEAMPWFSEAMPWFSEAMPWFSKDMPWFLRIPPPRPQTSGPPAAAGAAFWMAGAGRDPGRLGVLPPLLQNSLRTY